jgi:cysteinyl-tRNA synthetase
MFELFKKKNNKNSDKAENTSSSKEIYFKNTLTGKEEVFKPVNSGKVSMYHCGPTVYNRSHIGNMRAFVFDDLLGRLLRYYNYEVKQVINITDVGHLVSDGDEGEDKMEKSARELGKTAKEIADEYTELFMEDLDTLNIEKEEILFPRATDHIPEQIEIIEILEKKGLTYKIDDGIYYDTSKIDYGVLGNIKVDDLKEGARIEKSSGKKNSTDFALWKFSNTEGDRQQEWDSPWGLGFPGWHLECSAMSHKLLGTKFDIHTGGIEHIQIHHNNEIAQSQQTYGEIQANYWMHNGHVLFGNEKMSKSLGNVIYLSDFEERNIDPIIYRYWLLTSGYSVLTNFTWESLSATATAYNKILKHFNGAELSGGVIVEKYLNKALDFIRDNLNTAGAIATISELLKDNEISKANQYKTLLEIDKLLGLKFEVKIKENKAQNNLNSDQSTIPAEILKKAEERQNMRKSGDYEGADRLRDEINAGGYEVVDKGDDFEVLRK